MSRLKDISDQLKKHSNQQRLWIELFDIIEKLGGLETATQELQLANDKAKATLAETSKELLKVQQTLDQQRLLVSKATQDSKDIIASANQAAEVVVKAAQDEADSTKAKSAETLAKLDSEIATQASDLGKLREQIEAAKDALQATETKIESVKREALERFS